MTSFWLGAAVLAGVAMWLLLPGLLRRPAAVTEQDATRAANLTVLRDQRRQLDAELAAGTLNAEQHRAAREDIERRVLEEEGATAARDTAPAQRPATRTAWSLGLALPALAVGLYLHLGKPQALGPLAATPMAAASAPAGNEEPSDEAILAMVEQLAKRMADRPDDLEGWTMLARTYGAMQRYEDASRAYTRATQLSPKDAHLLADHADVLAMAQGQSAAGEPTRLVERALQIDPDNLKALALAGTAAAERGDAPAAVRYWTRASELAPPGGEFALALAEGLKQARANLPAAGAPAGAASGLAAVAAPAVAASSSAAPIAAAQVSGRVSLAPGIAARVAPTDTVFVVARAASGPRIPLAVLRRTASELPMRFTLDDSMAMAPELKLSAFPQVVLTARISKSGSATPSPEDLVVHSAPVAVGQRDIELVLERPAP